MNDQFAVVLENDQLSVRMLETSDVTAVHAFDLIAAFSVHDHIHVAVLKHEEMFTEPTQISVPVITGVKPAHLSTALVKYGVFASIK